MDLPGDRQLRLLRALANGTRAGMNPAKALRGFCEREKTGGDLAAAAADLDAGVAVAEALRRRPALFSPWIAELAAVGEANGRFDEAFALAAGILEERRSFLLKLAPRLAYPLLLLHVLPFAVNAPLIMSCGERTYLLRSLAWLSPLYLAAAFFWDEARKQTGLWKALIGSRRWDALRLPVFSSILSRLTRSGLALSKALSVAAAASGFGARPEVDRAREAVEAGRGAAEALRNLALFDDEELALLESAEASGRLPEEIDHLAESAREKKDALAATALAVGPALLLLLAALLIAWKVSAFHGARPEQLLEMMRRM